MTLSEKVNRLVKEMLESWAEALKKYDVHKIPLTYQLPRGFTLNSIHNISEKLDIDDNELPGRHIDELRKYRDQQHIIIRNT